MFILLNKTTVKNHINLLQLIGFQGVWFAWALGIPAGMLWPGVMASTTFLLLHGLWRKSAAADQQAVLISILAGFLLDSLLMHLGWLSFAVSNPDPLALWQPWWMALLWACLGCTLHHSLAWLKDRALLAAILGAASGVLSYEGAARMGTLTLIPSEWAWPLLALFWALFVPWAQDLGSHPQPDSLG
jgi:hypothetical protein